MSHRHAHTCNPISLQQEKSRRDELAREKDKLQGQVAELGGMVKSHTRLLELEKVRQGSICVSDRGGSGGEGWPGLAWPSLS